MPTKMSAIRSVSVVSGCRAPRGRAVPRQRDVDPLLGQHPRVPLGLQLGQPRGVGRGDRLAGGVDPLAGVAAGGRGQRAELAAGQQHRRAVAEVRRPDGGQRLQVAGRRERLLRRGHRVVEGLRRERGDLLGVVGIIGARHGRPFCPPRVVPRAWVPDSRAELAHPAPRPANRWRSAADDHGSQVSVPERTGASRAGARTGWVAHVRPGIRRSAWRSCWPWPRPSSTARRTSSAGWPAGRRRCSAWSRCRRWSASSPCWRCSPGSAARSDPPTSAWGGAAGLAGAAGLVVFFRALAGGVMSVIAPVTAVTAAAVPVLVGLLAGNRIGAVGRRSGSRSRSPPSSWSPPRAGCRRCARRGRPAWPRRWWPARRSASSSSCSTARRRPRASRRWSPPGWPRSCWWSWSRSPAGSRCG